MTSHLVSCARGFDAAGRLLELVVLLLDDDASWRSCDEGVGSWGGIRTDPIGEGPDGKPQRHRGRAYYRDFDGLSRLVEASGRTRTLATNTCG